MLQPIIELKRVAKTHGQALRCVLSECKYVVFLC